MPLVLWLLSRYDKNGERRGGYAFVGGKKRQEVELWQFFVEFGTRIYKSTIAKVWLVTFMASDCFSMLRKPFLS